MALLVSAFVARKGEADICPVAAEQTITSTLSCGAAGFQRSPYILYRRLTVIGMNTPQRIIGVERTERFFVRAQEAAQGLPRSP